MLVCETVWCSWGFRNKKRVIEQPYQLNKILGPLYMRINQPGRRKEKNRNTKKKTENHQFELNLPIAHIARIARIARTPSNCWKIITLCQRINHVSTTYAATSNRRVVAFPCQWASYLPYGTRTYHKVPNASITNGLAADRAPEDV